MLALSLTGCGSAKEKVQEKVQEKVAENAIGGDVDINGDKIKIEKDGNTYESGENLDWKDDKIGGLPKPNAKISSFMDTGLGAFAGFEEMGIEDARAYVQGLADFGYTENVLSAEEGDMISYAANNSAGDSVAFSYNISSKDGTITYIPAGAGQPES